MTSGETDRKRLSSVFCVVASVPVLLRPRGTGRCLVDPHDSATLALASRRDGVIVEYDPASVRATRYYRRLLSWGLLDVIDQLFPDIGTPHEYLPRACLLDKTVLAALTEAGLVPGDVTPAFCNWLIGFVPGRDAVSRELSRLRLQAFASFPLLPFLWPLACEARYAATPREPPCDMPSETEFEMAVDGMASYVGVLAETSGLPVWLVRRLGHVGVRSLFSLGRAQRPTRRDMESRVLALAHAGASRFPRGGHWAHFADVLDAVHPDRRLSHRLFEPEDVGRMVASCREGAHMPLSWIELDGRFLWVVDAFREIQVQLAPIVWASAGVLDEGEGAGQSARDVIMYAVGRRIVQGLTYAQIKATALQVHKHFHRIRSQLMAFYPLLWVQWRWGAPCGRFVSSGGWTVDVVADMESLIYEGRTLEHCVVTYAPGCVAGWYVIVSIRSADGMCRSTAQIRLSRRRDALDNDDCVVQGMRLWVGQHKGRQNADPPDMARSTLKEWLSALATGTHPAGLRDYLDSLASLVAGNPEYNHPWESMMLQGKPCYDISRPEARAAAWEAYASFLSPVLSAGGMDGFVDSVLLEVNAAIGKGLT